MSSCPLRPGNSLILPLRMPPHKSSTGLSECTNVPITHLTFDCYGTLIDWETGILNALQPLLKSHGANAGPEKILSLYVDHEARLEKGDWRPYREVLREVSAGIAKDLGVTFSFEECDALP